MTVQFAGVIANQAGVLPASTGQVSVGPAIDINLGGGGSRVVVRGWIQIVTGTGATGVVVQIQKYINGNFISTLDNNSVFPALTVGVATAIPFQGTDPLPASEVDHIQYRIVVNQTGAPSATGSVNGGHVSVEV